MDEHKFKCAVRQADFNESALAEHAWSESHHVDWMNVEVMANPHDDSTRIVQEAICIRTTKDTLNRVAGALHDDYNCLIRRH